MERETIINFEESQEWAIIYTHNRLLLRTLQKLLKEYPEDVFYINKHADGAQTFQIHKEWIDIRPASISPFQRKRVNVKVRRNLHE